MWFLDLTMWFLELFFRLPFIDHAGTLVECMTQKTVCCLFLGGFTGGCYEDSGGQLIHPGPQLCDKRVCKCLQYVYDLVENLRLKSVP